MSIEVRIGDAVVTSEHPDATESFARVIAEVFSKNWMAGHPQDEPLKVTGEFAGGRDIDYTVRLIPVN